LKVRKAFEVLRNIEISITFLCTPESLIICHEELNFTFQRTLSIYKMYDFEKYTSIAAYFLINKVRLG